MRQNSDIVSMLHHFSPSFFQHLPVRTYCIDSPASLLRKKMHSSSDASLFSLPSVVTGDVLECRISHQPTWCPSCIGDRTMLAAFQNELINHSLQAARKVNQLRMIAREGEALGRGGRCWKDSILHEYLSELKGISLNVLFTGISILLLYRICSFEKKIFNVCNTLISMGKGLILGSGSGKKC